MSKLKYNIIGIGFLAVGIFLAVHVVYMCMSFEGLPSRHFLPYFYANTFSSIVGISIGIYTLVANGRS